MMKPSILRNPVSPLPMLAMLAVLSCAVAEEFTLNDGQVMSSASYRRTGNNIMIKVTTPEGGMIEMGVPVTRITKASFPEPPELAKARTAAESANASEVLSLTGDYVSRNGDYKDIPGSWWPQMAQLRLMALASADKDADAANLARETGAINNPSSESLARGGALFGSLPSKDTEAVVVGAKSMTRVGGDQGSALAQIALGRALLLKKDYTGALRAFLTVKVFYPSLAILQPPALMGAAQAYIGLKDEKRAALSLKQILESYPSSPQVPQAKKMAELLPKT